MMIRIFSSADVKDLKVPALARKYKCSDDYVRRVLKGNREHNSILAKSIVQDAIDTLSIVGRETQVTV